MNEQIPEFHLTNDCLQVILRDPRDGRKAMDILAQILMNSTEKVQLEIIDLIKPHKDPVDGFTRNTLRLVLLRKGIPTEFFLESAEIPI